MLRQRDGKVQWGKGSGQGTLRRAVWGQVEKRREGGVSGGMRQLNIESRDRSVPTKTSIALHHRLTEPNNSLSMLH
jgi:hypothetical protein